MGEKLKQKRIRTLSDMSDKGLKPQEDSKDDFHLPGSSLDHMLLRSGKKCYEINLFIGSWWQKVTPNRYVGFESFMYKNISSYVSYHVLAEVQKYDFWVQTMSALSVMISATYYVILLNDSLYLKLSSYQRLFFFPGLTAAIKDAITRRKPPLLLKLEIRSVVVFGL